MSEREDIVHPVEVTPMPCFKCDGKMVGLEFMVPQYQNGKSQKPRKRKRVYHCQECGAETSEFADWGGVFKARRELKKYYDDVRDGVIKPRKNK